jgi:hypothetical protein
MSKPALNWYGETMEEYQKANCIYCCADTPHAAHATELEAKQLDLPIPTRPSSLWLRDLIARGGLDAVLEQERLAALPPATEPASDVKTVSETVRHAA